jgi:hypothetical protein
MNKKPELSIDFADVKQGYFLGIVFPPLVPQSAEDQDEAEGEAEEVVDDMTGDTTEMEGSETEEEEFEATELNIAIGDALIPEANEWGASAFLQVNWIDVDYGILPVTEDRALETLVESLIEIAVATEKWMNKSY